VERVRYYGNSGDPQTHRQTEKVRAKDPLIGGSCRTPSGSGPIRRVLEREYLITSDTDPH